MEILNNIFQGKNLVIITIACMIVFIITFSMSVKSIGIFVLLALISSIVYVFRDKIQTLFFGGSGKLMLIMMVLFGLLGLIGYSVFAVLEHKKKIDANWIKYKCKPYVLPFAGWLIGPSSTSPTANFVDCMWVLNKSFFDVLISPFVDMFALTTDIMKGFGTDIQNIRQMISYLRQNLTVIAQDIYKKIYDDYARLSYLFQVVMQILSQIFTIFVDLFSVLEYIFYTIAALFSPIDDLMSIFCFHPDTPITMQNGATKCIKEIEVGDTILDNIRVEGVIKVSATNTQMYKYRDVIVSGCHLVNYGGEYKRVYQIDEAVPIKYSEKHIYCLITDRHIIPIKNIVFADYWGFDRILDKYKADMEVEVFLGGWKPMSELMIGDLLKDNNRVIGLVKYKNGINIITEKNMFMTREGKQKDFDRSSSPIVNRLLELYAERILNKH